VRESERECVREIERERERERERNKDAIPVVVLVTRLFYRAKICSLQI